MRGFRNRGHRGPLVGRAEELKRCEQLLDGELRALYLYGPPGLGKTRLLNECGKLAKARKMQVTRLDAQFLSRAPESLAEVAAHSADTSQPSLLVIDGFEAHGALEQHYRDQLLPHLPAECRLLFAGETPLSLPWQSHGAGRMVHVPLQPLSQLAAESYLEDMGVAAECRAHMATRASGNPLVLATMTEFVTGGQTQVALHEDHPCTLSELLQHILQEAPSHEHRQALWATAMARVLSERLLAAILDQPRSNECYRWLSTRPYIEPAPGGLVVHSLLRDPLLHDLRDHAPDKLDEFLLRCGRFHIGRLEGLRVPEQRRDCAYAHFYAQRLQDPMAALAEQWFASSLYRAPLGPEHLSTIGAALDAHEGPQTALAFQHWHRLHPEHTSVFRNSDHEPVALLQTLPLDERTVSAEYDPACTAALRILHRPAPKTASTPKGVGRPRRSPRGRRNALLVRFWVDLSHPQQASAAQAEILVHSALQALGNPDLALLLFAVPEHTLGQAESLLKMGLVQRFPQGDFSLDAHRHHLIGIDLHKTPAPRWLRDLLTKTISGERRLPTQERGNWDMGRTEFTQAVRQALRHFGDNRALSHSPLVQALPPDSKENAAHGLRRWLLDGVDRLTRMPGGSTYAKQLHRTYIDEPGGSAATAEEPPDLSGQRDSPAAAELLLIATLWDALMQHRRVGQLAL